MATNRTMVGLSSLWILSSALIAGEKAAAPSKVQERIGRVLRQLASEIDKRTQGQRVVVVEIPGDGESNLAASVQGLVLQALLAQSVLVAPLGDDDRKVLLDDKGKFSLKTVLSPSSLEHLRKTRELKILVLSQIREQGKRLLLAVQCLDLVTGKQVLKVEFQLLEKAEVEVVKPIQILPPRNVKILLHAAGNLGKKVGAGECWDLPAKALQEDGFKVQGYDFGTRVPWPDVLPGDVITIDNGAAHHVMVLLKPGKEMRQSKILHQNWNKQRFVVRDQLPSAYSAKDLVFWRPGVRS